MNTRAYRRLQWRVKKQEIKEIAQFALVMLVWALFVVGGILFTAALYVWMSKP